MKTTQHLKYALIPLLALTFFRPEANGQFQLLENFDSYAAGSLLADTDNWSVNAGNFSVQSVGGNNAGRIALTAPGTSAYANFALPGTAQIADGATGTYFFQLQYGTTTSGYNAGIGVASGAVTAPGEQGAYVLPSSSSDTRTLQVRNGGSQSTVKSGMAAETWHNIWLVVTNTTGTANATYDVYTNIGDINASVADLVADNFVVRDNPGAGSIDTFFLSYFNNHTSNVYVDNIYFASGVDLSYAPIPEPSTYALMVGAAACGLAVIVRRKRKQQ